MPAGFAILPQGVEMSFAARAAAVPDGRLRSVVEEMPAERKPLRAPKERLPVAAEVDEEQLLGSADVVLPPPAAPALAVAPVSSPPPILAFDGGLDDNTSIPPDTAGAVGLDHVFNPLNNNVTVFTRGGTALSVVKLDRFWADPGTSLSTFDPRVVYDPFEHRFIFVTMANGERPDSALLIAVSKTGDPTGEWATAEIQVDPQEQGEVWLDYPSVGFTADKITVQVNLFTRPGNRFAGSSIYVWDKASFYEPPHQAAVTLFVLRNHGATHVPAITYDAQETRQFLVSRWASNAAGNGSYALYEVSGDVAQQTAQIRRVGFIQTNGLTWDSFSPSGDFAPQQGTSDRIDAGDDRLLSLVLRDGALWGSHTVYVPAGAPDRTAAQWFQFDLASATLQQLGRIEDPTGGRFYSCPTVAVNGAGDALMGLSSFSRNQHGSAACAFRAAADAAGTFRPPLDYGPGLNTYVKTFGGSANRWGDYSATQVDPTDDSGFWTVQERASAQQDTWATRWAHVRPVP